MKSASKKIVKDILMIIPNKIRSSIRTGLEHRKDLDLDGKDEADKQSAGGIAVKKSGLKNQTAPTAVQ